MKILIVDDSALMRRHLSLLFEKDGGFEIRLARNGEEAVKENLKSEDFFHLGAAANLPYGFAYEITKQFWGANSRFKASCLGASSNLMIPLSST